VAGSPRQKWAELKPGTKKRKLAWYAKHQGLTAAQVRGRYNAGTLGPQTATRGHAQTPERPERLKTGREAETEDKYKRYRDKIMNTIEYIQDFKRDKWDWPYQGVAPFDEGRSKMAVRKDPETGKLRGVKDLQIIKAMVDIAKRDAWMDWHGIVALDYEYENAFWYH
jgi:hypothetical protein